MSPALVSAGTVAALVVGLLCVVAAARGLAPGRVQLRALLGLQLVLLGQLAYVLYRLSGGERPAETGAFAGYVVLSLLLLPGGLALAVEERTRWGSLVLAIACLVVAVVELRLAATWG